MGRIAGLILAVFFAALCSVVSCYFRGRQGRLARDRVAVAVAQEVHGNNNPPPPSASPGSSHTHSSAEIQCIGLGPLDTQPSTATGEGAIPVVSGVPVLGSVEPQVDPVATVVTAETAGKGTLASSEGSLHNFSSQHELQQTPTVEKLNLPRGALERGLTWGIRP